MVIDSGLREKIANRIFVSGMLRERVGGDQALWDAARRLADFVADIPEIKGALEREAAIDFPPDLDPLPERLTDPEAQKRDFGTWIET